MRSTPSRRRDASHSLRIDSGLRTRRGSALGLLLIPDQAALGEDHWPFGCRQLSQKPADNFLGMTQAVHGGGIYPIDALLQGMSNGPDGLVIVLRSPTVSPTATAERPCAKAGYGDLDSTQPSERLGKLISASSVPATL